MVPAYEVQKTVKGEQRRQIIRLDEATLRSYIENPLQLSFEDIVYLDSHNAGLRHVSSLEDGENELNHGVRYGCSVNLCVSESNILREYHSNRFLTPESKTELFQTLSLEQKEELVEKFRKALHFFISSSIYYDQGVHDAVIDVGYTTYEQYFNVFEDTVFNLISYPQAMLAFCIDADWSGNALGRFTNARIDKEHLTPIPLPSAALLGRVLNKQGIIRDQAEIRNVIEQMNNLFISIVIGHCRMQMQLESTAAQELAGGLSKLKV